MNRQIEILAPAGSYEGMKAAMNAGCDAVYIGGHSFGARAYANNLDNEMLLQAIDEAHRRDKKLYLTVNTLIKEKERLEELYQFLEQFYIQGLDAVIVQDVGVMHFIHHHFPDLPIHASTQTTLMMAQGANLLKEIGVTRMVTARELSLPEIKNIRDNTDLEIETFVHGALCYCYSGQCFMSSMIGGRSGNRGRCAQPCRMPYQFHHEDKQKAVGKEKYLLSPKDICAVPLIPDMIDAGIDSFKIEGRMKRPEYAAAVSHIYRKYVDLYFSMGREQFKCYTSEKNKDYVQDMMNLQDIYSRGEFSEGYFNHHHGKHMMSMYRPNHSGVYVGDVTAIKGKQVAITLKEKVNAQDILEIRTGDEKGYEFTVKDSHNKGDVLRTNVGSRPIKGSNDPSGKSIRFSTEPSVKVSNQVYRTKNNELLECISREYMQEDKKTLIHGVLRAKYGEKLTLTVSNSASTVTAYHEEVQPALKQPMTEEKLSAQIKKTGDSNYIFEELIIDMDDNIFVPVAWLNEIRREALQRLTEADTIKYRRIIKEDIIEENLIEEVKGLKEVAKQNKDNSFGICVSVQTEDQFDIALGMKEVTAIYMDYDTLDGKMRAEFLNRVRETNKKCYLLLPHICRRSVYERLENDIEELKTCGMNGYIVKNFEEVTLLQEIFKDTINDIEIVLNHNMYVFNREAKDFWNEHGIIHYTAPVELNYQELKQLEVKDCDLIVYGYLPLMVSAQCLYESTEGCKKSKSKNLRNSFLVDRYQKKFYVQTNCNGCYNIIYNGQCLTLLKQVSEICSLNPKNIRLDFTLETKEEMKKVLNAFIGTYCYGEKNEFEMTNNTTGHFKRGVE